MKTIKQLADEIGVSKQAIFYRIKKTPLSNDLTPFISNVDGSLMILPEGETLIKQAFNFDPEKCVDAKEPSSAVKDKPFDVKELSMESLFNEPLTLDELVKILRDNTLILQKQLEFTNQQLTVKDQQLAAKDQQLEAKDQQIAKLTASLEQVTANLQAAQALHAGTIQKQLTDSQPVKEENPPADIKRRRWWQFWKVQLD